MEPIMEEVITGHRVWLDLKQISSKGENEIDNK